MSSLNHEPEGYTLWICGCDCAVGTLELLACTDSSNYWYDTLFQTKTFLFLYSIHEKSGMKTSPWPSQKQ